MVSTEIDYKNKDEHVKESNKSDNNKKSKLLKTVTVTTGNQKR